MREAEKLRVSGRIQRFRPDLRRVGEAGAPSGIAMTEAKAMITSASSIATKVFKILLSAGFVSRTGAYKREPVPSSANWVHSLGTDGALLSRFVDAERGDRGAKGRWFWRD